MNFRVNVIIARTFNILGNGLSPKLSIGSFVNQIKAIETEGTLTVGNLNTNRDFLDIDDVLDAYWKLLESGVPGETYNVCSGFSLSIKEVLEYLIEQSGKNIAMQIDANLLRKNDIVDFYGDNKKLMDATNWEMHNDIYKSLNEMLT